MSERSEENSAISSIIKVSNEEATIQWWEVISTILNSGILLMALAMFPFKLEMEGQGSYPIIQFIVLAFVIWPIIWSELLIGQLNQSGAIKVWGHMVPMINWIGYTSMVVSVFMIGSGSSLASLSAFYWSKSFKQPLPWTTYDSYNSTLDGNSSASAYYKYEAFPFVSKLTDDIGLPHWHLCLCMIGIWIWIFFINFIWTNLIPSIAVVLSLIPYVILGFLLLGSVGNGAAPNVIDSKWPSFKALARPEIWISSVVQCLIYLPLGIGTATRVASLRGLHDNLSNIATFICFWVFFTERLVSVFFHTILQDHSNRTGVPASKYLKSGPVTLLVTLPEYFSSLDNFPQAISIAYFTLLVLICSSRLLVLFRGLNSALQEIWPTLSRTLSMVASLTIGIASSLPFLTPHGKLIAYAVNSFGIILMKTIAVLVESIAIQIYGIKNLCTDFRFMSSNSPSIFTRFNLKIMVAPVLVSATVLNFVATLSSLFSSNSKAQTDPRIDFDFLMMVAIAVSWLMLGISELIIYADLFPHKPLVLKASQYKWGPKDATVRVEWKAFKETCMSVQPMKMKNDDVADHQMQEELRHSCPIAQF